MATQTQTTTKAEYWVKKDAQSILNYARENSNRKRLPVRIYCEDNMWHMTSSPKYKHPTILDDIDNILKYWGDPKSQAMLSKEEKELTKRTLNKLNFIKECSKQK